MYVYKAILPFLSLYDAFSCKLAAYAPVLLEQKASQLRKENKLRCHDCRRIRTVFAGDDREYVSESNASEATTLTRFTSWKHILAKNIIRPLELFIGEPIIQLLGVYMAFVYV